MTHTSAAMRPSGRAALAAARMLIASFVAARASGRVLPRRITPNMSVKPRRRPVAGATSGPALPQDHEIIILIGEERLRRSA